MKRGFLNHHTINKLAKQINRTMQRYLVIAAITLALFGHKARAETNVNELSFNAFLEQVLGSNLELTLDQLNQLIEVNQALHEAGEVGEREVRADRFPDISLVAGYHNEAAISPMPGFSAAYGGLIIPLKFSGLNRGAFRESVAYHEQANHLFDLTRLEAESELLSAWQSYLLISQKRLLFSESILQDAERVRDAIAFSYQRGEVSLLELLDAQRTMNEVYMNYYETLAQYAESIVRLSEVSGQWFVVLE